jgi:hypothetical protein
LNWPHANVRDDDADPTGVNRALRVEDSSPATRASAETLENSPCDPSQEYQLAWRARAEGTGHSYELSVSPFDAAGARIAGRNFSTGGTAASSWGVGADTIPTGYFPAETAAVRVAVWARPYGSDPTPTGTTWFDDVSLRRVGGPELIVNGDLQADVESSADFAGFDAAAAFALDELAMDSFQVPLENFASCTNAGPRPATDLLGHAWGTTGFDAAYEGYLRAIEEHLAERGWLDRALFYWSDEPRIADLAFTRHGMELLGRGAPGVRRLLTREYVEPLGGAVDVWVPLIDRHRPGWARARQALGEEVWWYVCNVPHAPFPTNFIDHPGLAHRIRYWLAWKFGVQGDLYWQTTYWTMRSTSAPDPAADDPWRHPMSGQTGADGTFSRFGNGEGRLLYPPRDWVTSTAPLVEGPVPSVRWELIREGLEDFEYLWLLDDAADRLEARGGAGTLVATARELLELPPELAFSASQYVQDPYVLADYRTRVAALLEELLRELETAGGEDDLDGGEDAEDDGTSDDGGDAARDVPCDGGCTCEVTTGRAPGGSALVLLPALIALRRRRHRRPD